MNWKNRIRTKGKISLIFTAFMSACLCNMASAGEINPTAEVSMMVENEFAEDTYLTDNMYAESYYMEPIELNNEALYDFAEDFSGENEPAEVQVKEDRLVRAAALASVPASAGYFRGQLNAAERAVYDTIAAANVSLSSPDVDVSGCGASSSEVYRAGGAYLLDHPEQMAWLNQSTFGYNRYYIEFYEFDDPDLETKVSVMKQKVDEIIAEMPLTSQYDQIVYFNDWLVDNSEYIYSASWIHHTALGAFTVGRSVCEGYAKAFQILCDRAGITCVFVVSNNHAFNYVLMEDGQWYLVDCTHNDRVGIDQTMKEWYKHGFLLDANNPPSSADHTPWKSYYNLEFPIASKTDYMGMDSCKHIWDDGVITTEAKCNTYGEITYTCTLCNKVTTHTIAQTEHDYILDNIFSQPTCTDTGAGNFHCSYCGFRVSKRVPATGHSWSEIGEVTIPATCRKLGTMSYRCTNSGCTESITEDIPLVPHKPKVIIVDGHAPTCLKPGYCYEIHRCTECNENLEMLEIEIPPTKDHTWTEPSLYRPATCTREGLIEQWCKVCYISANKEIPKLEHIYDDGTDLSKKQCSVCGTPKLTCDLKTNGNTKEIVVTVNDKKRYDSIGILYNDDSIPDLDTPGRTRVAFTEMQEDSTVHLDVSECTGSYTFRAYAIYRTEQGTEEIFYSEPFTVVL